MADTKITGLTSLSAAPATGDLFELVDISDTTMASTGTNKKITAANLLSGVYVAGGTDVAITDGGTGASSAASARTNLGLDTMATQAAGAVAITGGSVTGITDVAVADGGTGSSTASAARTALGVPQDVNPGWTTYTPTWTNFTTGNGSVAGRWAQHGKTVFFDASFAFGSTSAVGGLLTFSLPVTATTPTGLANTLPRAWATFWDNSALTVFGGVAAWASTTTMIPLAQSYDGSSAGVAYVKDVQATTGIPITWATSDRCQVYGFYEAA